MFVAALFTTAKRWVNPNVHGWRMDKHSVVHPFHGILFNLKIRETLTYATIRINLVDIMLSEISQTQKTKFCMLPPT